MKIFIILTVFLFYSLLPKIKSQNYGIADINNFCCLPADPGSCNSPQARYYYNCLGKYCDSFIYYGCDGNSNNFQTLKECERFCNGV